MLKSHGDHDDQDDQDDHDHHDHSETTVRPSGEHHETARRPPKRAAERLRPSTRELLAGFTVLLARRIVGEFTMNLLFRRCRTDSGAAPRYSFSAARRKPILT